MEEENLDVLWILAHPDDESFGGAGVLAWAHESGLTTGLLCATRGEAGQISNPALGTPGILGAVRERELRQAMEVVNLTELRLLGFRDSGMAGTPENDDPRAFINVPRDEAISHVAMHIRDLQPKTVITFGPDGGYGHPDHIYIGDVTDQAVIAAAEETPIGLGEPWQISALYHVAIPRDVLLAWRKRADGPFRSMSEEDAQKLGTPSEEITHWADTIDFLKISRQTVIQHATQISDPQQFIADTPEAIARMRFQQFQRQSLPWDPNSTTPDALDELVASHPNSTRDFMGMVTADAPAET